MYTGKLLHTANFYTDALHTASFYTEKLLHREALSQGSIYTEKLYTEELLHRSLYTQKPWHIASFYTELYREAFFTESFYTEQAFTQRSMYTGKLLHTANFYTDALHTASFDTEREAPSQGSIYNLHWEAFTQRSFYTQQAFKLRKSADKPLLQARCSHSITIYDLRCPAAKDKILHTQPRLQITLTQPLQCDLQRLCCKTQKNYAQRHQQLQLQNRISTPNQQKKTVWKHFEKGFFKVLKMIFKRKITSAKIEKICWQITIAALWCSHTNTIYDVQLQKTKVVRTQPRRLLMRPAETELQNTKEPRATGSEIAAPKADLGDSWRCENEAFVRDLPQNLKVEGVKGKLSCETSLRIWKLKVWKQSFRARPPSESESWRCESKAFVRDLLQNLKVENVKTKLSCKTSSRFRHWKMWKWSFRATRPSKSESGRCENEAFLRDLCQNLKVKDVKTKLSCETSLKK